MGNLPSCSRQPPIASKCSRAKPKGCRRGWHGGQVALGRCLVGILFRGTSFPRACSLRVGTSGGGGGGGAFSNVSSIHLPRKTGDVRLAYDDTVSTLA